MNMVAKACTRCGRVLPLSEYHLHRKRKDGRTARCKECAKAVAREWHESNRDRHVESMRQYQRANRESINETTRAYREANRESVRATFRKWKAANLERVRALARFHRMNTRAKQFGCAWFYIAPADRRRLLSSSCSVDGCSDGPIHVDHMIPLSRGGHHAIGNLQPLCRKHNMAKGALTWMEFRLVLRASGARPS